MACAVAFPGVVGNPGWLVFGLLLGRFTGIYHPPAPDERPLSTGRQVLGWLMVVIFVLCFTPSPFHECNLSAVPAAVRQAFSPIAAVQQCRQAFAR